MLEDQYTSYEQDHILLPEDMLDEALPGYHVTADSLLAEGIHPTLEHEEEE